MKHTQKLDIRRTMNVSVRYPQNERVDGAEKGDDAQRAEELETLSREFEVDRLREHDRTQQLTFRSQITCEHRTFT